jgi:cytidylate kinase
MAEKKNNIVIAIDGPAGSGKSSTAKAVAGALGILHLDTGAMYRAITLKCLRKGIDRRDEAGIGELLKKTEISFAGSPQALRIMVDGEDVTDAIRGDDVTKNVSDYCTVPAVRRMLVEQQRNIGRAQSVVCEGRDIGTVVFPDAKLKFFLVASAEERARRRQKDFAAMGVIKSIRELATEIRERDRKDSTRKNSPLKKADGAEEIDTTTLTFEQQVRRIVDRARAVA